MNPPMFVTAADEIAAAIGAVVFGHGATGPQNATCTITVREPEVVVLGEIMTCPICLAYRDGYMKAPRDGFCLRCGRHMGSIRKASARAHKKRPNRPFAGGF